MKPLLPDKARVFAIDPCPRGFGYVVLEGKEALVDWGLKIPGSTPVDKNAWCLTQIERLIVQFQPNIIVMEKVSGKCVRRCTRVKKLIQETAAMASQLNLKVHIVTRTETREAFARTGGLTKHEIAIEIAKRFPEIAPRLPRIRKPWMCEDSRMSIFDAVAMVVTFFHCESKRQRTN